MSLGVLPRASSIPVSGASSKGRAARADPARRIVKKERIAALIVWVVMRRHNSWRGSSVW